MRLASGGRIDRMKRVRFSYDGLALEGFAGDTLASALLANGRRLIGRSFKYHRPRGAMTAGVDEPNALFTLGDGARAEPNIPGTAVELIDGLVAHSQNAWPSPAFDLRAVNQLAAPLFHAGFYYKTFMGPARGSWMLYEPAIRRAAGLGAGTHEPDPDRYETAHGFCDVLVIGCGPAGIAAALAAGRSGVRVWLAEQDFELGGSLLSEPVQSPHAEWLASRLAELAALPNVRCLPRTTVLGLYDGNLAVLCERRDRLRPDPAKGEARQAVTELRFGSAVVATGALERPLVFANNDRPGVMLASAARTYLNRFGVVPGKRVVVLANNTSVLPLARDLIDAGCSVTLAAAPGLEFEAPNDAGVVEGVVTAEVRGRAGVAAVALNGTEQACDSVLMSGGWSPALHLTSHGGVRPRFDAAHRAFVPGALRPDHHAAGAVMGTTTLSAAVRDGAAAGAAAARRAGRGGEGAGGDPPDGDGPYRSVPVWHIAGPKRAKAFVDFQNDVTLDDVRLAHEEGYESVEHLKRYTTLGMGTDQGKSANVNAIAAMAELRGVPMAEAGTTTFRPPYTPVALGAIAGRNVGSHFRAVRRSPLHDWHAANGAAFIEAGPWLRAWYYDWAGKTPEDAYVREMELVRRGVGLADVSTLGKIDVQGPDAAEFLDRVYVNGFARLAVGKARYGVMLTDDGVVLDDGTTTRLSDARYFMTTTTAQAGEVMSWLEFLLQTAWTDLKVQVTSLTDRYAAMALSGPRSRAALEAAFPGVDVSTAALPHMGAMEFAFEGVHVRLVRLSFSGELAYEIYAAADHGIALWEHILAAAAPLGIKPYGLEALASLRVEKGHVAGLELDRRNTLDDLGLGRMASKTKAFVGRELRMRPELQAPERWSLVGIEPLDDAARLRGGAILFAKGDRIEGHGRGYITSVTWSTELGKFIALGLYRGGLERTGDEIVCAFPLKKEYVRARIVSPHFLDPAGERLHA